MRWIQKQKNELMENGVKVLYLRLLKSLRGCMESAFLWSTMYTKMLKSIGFIINPYDRGTYCYNTGRPLRYHRDDSVVVFQYYNKSTQHWGRGFDSQFSERWNSSTKSSGTSYGKQLPRTSCTRVSSPAEAIDGLETCINTGPSGEEKCWGAVWEIICSSVLGTFFIIPEDHYAIIAIIS